jgi:hypothetical protein
MGTDDLKGSLRALGSATGRPLECWLPNLKFSTPLGLADVVILRIIARYKLQSGRGTSRFLWIYPYAHML